MKKLIASLAAVALFAGPALAELAPRVIPQGSYTITPYEAVDDASRGISYTAGIYNNLTGPTTESINNGGFFVGDDVHMTGATMTAFQWIYVDGGTGSHSSLVAFFYNTPGDGGPLLGNTVTFVSGTQTYGAVFNITGLPQATAGNTVGGWLITVTLPTVVLGTDAWVGLSTNSTTPTGPIGPGSRPGLRSGNNPTVGSSHDLYWSGFYATPPYTSFFTSPTDSNLRMAILPEPAVAAVLGIGGLLALRRRRAK
jgi:hypothetical protein